MASVLKQTEAYQAMPAKVSQQVLRGLDRNWKSFFQALSEFNSHPDQFLGRPKIPKYKDTKKGRNLLVYTIQALSKVARRICPYLTILLLTIGVIEMTKTNYQAIYLSPHLDDMALSCGGQIYQRTQNHEKILIVTVMAGDPPSNLLSSYAQGLHHRWEINTQTVQKRHQEDRQAAEILGADVIHWQIPDCIYRFDQQNNRPLYTSDDQIFGDIHPQDAQLVDSICQMIAHLPCHHQLFIPLGVGDHVDHRLTRAAAEKAIQFDKNIRPQQVWYYEEYPYAQTQNGTEDILNQYNGIWQLELIGITEMALSHRIDAIAQFQSQMSTLFQSPEDMATQVSEFVHRVGGERLWCQI